jgi:Predicted membrane protein
MLQAIDPRHRRVGHGERGAIAIIAAIVMPIMILALAFGIDIAHLTYVHRNLQKMADMSAIAGAEDIPNAQTVATANAVKNGLQVSTTQMTVTPGNWNPQIEVAPTYFSATVPTGHQVNAVQVQLSQTVPYSFFRTRENRAGASHRLDTQCGGFFPVEQSFEYQRTTVGYFECGTGWLAGYYQPQPRCGILPGPGEHLSQPRTIGAVP